MIKKIKYIGGFMKKIVLLCLLATFLLAQNPKIYSALGDVIYNNVDKIQKLKEIPQYTQYENRIDSYVKEVYETKDMGYAIEAGNKNLNKMDYLKKIRDLSKTNDFFHRDVVNSFKSSMIEEDNNLFSQTLNSGLIDSEKYKGKILEYYFVHCTDMNATGVIQKYLDEDEMLKKLQEKSKQSIVTKKQIQEAKIKRIRLKDKEKQEEIKKALEEELIKKKSDIRKEQVKELAK